MTFVGVNTTDPWQYRLCIPTQPNFVPGISQTPYCTNEFASVGHIYHHERVQFRSKPPAYRRFYRAAAARSRHDTHDYFPSQHSSRRRTFDATDANCAGLTIDHQRQRHYVSLYTWQWMANHLQHVTCKCILRFNSRLAVRAR